MLKDVKIVIQVYQIWVGMGVTLNVAFPEIVLQFIALFKDYLSFDFFQLPGLGCLAPSSYYHKLYVQLLTPTLLMVYFVIMYFRQVEVIDLDLSNKGHNHDPDQDKKLEGKLAEQHKQTRKDGPLKSRAGVDGATLNNMSEDERAAFLENEERKLAKSMGNSFLGLGDDEDEMSDNEARARYERIEKKAALKRTVVSRLLFIVFLAYPGITNRLFGFFMCYQTGIYNQQYMFEDFAESCHSELYSRHVYICSLLMLLIPLGIPLFMLALLHKHGEAIRKHEGPHEYEALYIDYKPDCYRWEVYMMAQKVALIGMLTFVDRGSILQSIIGLFIATVVLSCLLEYKPYAHSRSNLLACLGQGMIVLSYMISLLLRVNLDGEEYLTRNMIGFFMLLSNAPMLISLGYDLVVTVRDELHHVRIDLLRYELGRVGSRYQCIDEEGVSMHKTMMRPKLAKHQKPRPPVGRIEFGEIVTVNSQAVVFQNGGAVGRLHKQSEGDGDTHGWFSYNHHGVFGKRHFKLADQDLVQGMCIGKLHTEIRRFNERLRCNILKIDWSDRFLLEAIGEVADDEERAVVVFVEVRVNSERKRTAGATFMDVADDSKGPSWNEGVGQALLYDVTDPDDPDGTGLVECISVKVLMGDPVADAEADKTDEDYVPPRFLGEVVLDLGDRLTQDEWEWDMFDFDAVELHQEMRPMTLQEKEEKARLESLGLQWKGPSDEKKQTTTQAAKGKSLSEQLHQQAQLTKLRKGGTAATNAAASAAASTTSNPLAALAVAQKIRSGKFKSDPKAFTGHYRTVKATTLQAGAEISSRKTGQLKAGELVEITETKVLRDGTLRLRVGKRGWTSKKSAQGFDQMHRVKMQHRVATAEKKRRFFGKGKESAGGQQVANPMFQQ